MIFDLNGLVFNDNIADENGVYWYVQEIDGWDAPAVRSSSVDPTTRHGVNMVRGLLDARAVVIKGLVKAPTTVTFWGAWDHLQKITNSLFETFPLTVTEHADLPLKRLNVIRAASAVRMRHVGVNAFSFEVGLIAPDPLKYGIVPTTTTISAGLSKTINNAGTFTTENFELKAKATGLLNVYNETVGERGIATDIEVPLNSTINALTRDVLDGTRNMYHHLSAATAWFGLLPGDNVIKNRGAVGVDLTHYPAWL